jgi:hypothetical protein
VFSLKWWSVVFSIKSSRFISRVRWKKEIDGSGTNSVFIIRDVMWYRSPTRNVGFFNSSDAADRPRRFYWILSSRMLQVVLYFLCGTGWYLKYCSYELQLQTDKYVRFCFLRTLRIFIVQIADSRYHAWLRLNKVTCDLKFKSMSSDFGLHINRKIIPERCECESVRWGSQRSYSHLGWKNRITTGTPSGIWYKDHTNRVGYFASNKFN